MERKLPRHGVRWDNKKGTREQERVSINLTLNQSILHPLSLRSRVCGINFYGTSSIDQPTVVPCDYPGDVDFVVLSPGMGVNWTRCTFVAFCVV